MRPLDDEQRAPDDSTRPSVYVPPLPRYYRSDYGSVFALSEQYREYRLDGGTWVEVSDVIPRYMVGLRDDLDMIDPPASMPPLPKP